MDCELFVVGGVVVIGIFIFDGEIFFIEVFEIFLFVLFNLGGNVFGVLKFGEYFCVIVV